MGIATGTLPFFGNNTGPLTATKRPADIGTYDRSVEPSKQNFSQSDKQSTASQPKRRSFFLGAGQDLINTLSRVLCGGLMGDIFNGILKDGKLHLDGVVHSNFMEGFGSRFFADFLGAISERLFNGETSILGIPIPKVPAEASSQILTNIWVHIWRFFTNKFNPNQISSAADQSPEVVSLRQHLGAQPWLEKLEEANKYFKEKVKPGLEKVIGFFFGVKGAKPIKDVDGNVIFEKDADGKVILGKEGKPKPKETPASVNWWKLGPMTLGSLIATMFLPKDTQQFGFSGIYNAKGGLSSIFRTFTSVGTAVLGRLESTYFRNVLGMHRNGFSGDACLKATVRERMLVPISQYVVDAFSALLTRNIQKVIPINGATLSMLLRFPFEMMSNLLSSSLVGIAESHRVPSQWAYLGTKYWKPVAKIIEAVSRPLIWVVDHLYRFCLHGILPTESQLAAEGFKYREYDKEGLGDNLIAKYKGNKFIDDVKLLLRSLNPVNFVNDIKAVVKSANEQSKQIRKDALENAKAEVAAKEKPVLEVDPARHLAQAEVVAPVAKPKKAYVPDLMITAEA